MERHVRLVLCRHTETDFNAQKRLSGARQNVWLNAVGERQAEELADRLQTLPICAIYTSDLIRAYQVGVRLAVRFKLPVIQDARLREVDIGSMSGMTEEMAQDQYPAAHFRNGDPQYDFRPIGGESRHQVIARQLECFAEITRRYGKSETEAPSLVAVVGHGTALRTILQHLGDPSSLHAQGQYQFLSFHS